MRGDTLLWLILIATVAAVALTAPLGVLLRDELRSARSRARQKGLEPLGVAAWLAAAVAFGAWFAYSWQTGQWLFFAIAASTYASQIVFRWLSSGVTDDAR